MKVALLFAVAFWASAQAPDTDIQLDRQAVYRVVLQDGRCSGRGSGGAKGNRPVFRQELVNPRQELWWQFAPPPPLAERLPSMMPGLRSVLLQEFLSVSDTKARWTGEVAQGLGADVVSNAELEQMASRGWVWDLFYQRFPSASALVDLSAVAIDRTAGEALVYCGSSTNALDGSGFLVLLRRKAAAAADEQRGRSGRVDRIVSAARG